ncbi:MAG TPA: DUF5683 domain-containing protein, partial [Rhodothermales bacterium]|nr:DUF5683 domain-containing protein [Rhodothermales bacterium]
MPCSAYAQTGDDAAGRSPRGALTRALVLPGWGQLYNGQPLKAAVVWAGLGGLGTGVILQHRRYLQLRHAAIYTVCIDTDPGTTCADPAYARYAEEAAPYEGYRADALRNLRDRARRNRDLFLVGTSAGVALQALDAYVSAHLLSFDVDERLSVQLVPGPGGATWVLRTSLP